MASISGAGTGQSKELGAKSFLWVSHRDAWAKDLSHLHCFPVHMQGTELEVKLLALEPAPICNAITAWWKISLLTHCASL